MLYLISPQQNKPNRLETTEADKTEQYHINYGRWVIASGSTQMHQRYLRNYQINRSFYKNNQWCIEEDLEAFFKDESGQDRNRLKVTRNYIQPMVEQYRGNAERMTFDMKVVNLSPMARSRRERSLNQLKSYNMIARGMPGFSDYMRENNFPMGRTDTEVEDKFNNMYADQNVIAINRLMRYSKNINKLEEIKGQLAKDVALAGIAVMRPYPYAGEWILSRVLPDKFGWDRSAQDACLVDSEYFFEDDILAVPSLFERYPNISPEARTTIERYSVNVVGSSIATNVKFDAMGKVPMFRSMWRDLVVDTFGYVTDEFGQRILGRINYVEENESKPRYTTKDIIPFRDLTDYQKKVMRGGSTALLYVDLWRYCEFIPGEIIAVSKGTRGGKDIALEWGMLPYQEPDLYRPTNMLPPYKVGTWSYMDGEVLSPVDVVINPQRMINRFLSVMENQINNSGGAGVVFDKDLIGATPEDEIRSSINKGEPIGVYAKGRGVQNIFGRYDSTPKEALVVFSQLIDSFKLGIEQVTGVNEGVKGESNNPNQLVGVMQLMIQRGSIIQEPFYKAVTDVFRGCYQSVISSGKRYYVDNDVELMDAVGEDSAQVLKLSKNVRNESMRVFLTRSIDTANERLNVDSTLMSWLQFGLLDQETVSKLYGRATMEEALLEMREFQKRLAVQKRMAAQQQAAMQQTQSNVQSQAGDVLYNEGVRDKAREDMNKQADRQTKLEIAGMKSGQ